MDIVLWQNMPSHHQSGAIRLLADSWSGEMHGVYDMEMMPSRKEQGWAVPDMGKTHLHFLDSMESPSQFVDDFVQAHQDAIHILGGFRGSHSVVLAFASLVRLGNPKLVSILERPHFNGWKSPLQKLWYRRFLKKHSGKFRAVLAMGHLGVDSLKRLGCPSEILFPCMYQVNHSKEAVCRSTIRSDSDIVRMIYIGRFDSRKGIDILLKAVDQLPESGWHLTLAGGGGGFEPQVLARVSETSDNRIEYAGRWPSDEVVTRLQDFDVAVVPSRHDGWGMVVSEALAAEIGVIASDNTGAMDLIRFSGAGKIFPTGSVQGLANALSDIVADPSCTVEWKTKAKRYQPYLSTALFAKYLEEVLTYTCINDMQSNRPRPPWECFLQ